MPIERSYDASVCTYITSTTARKRIMKLTIPIDTNASVSQAMATLGIKKTAFYELLKKPSENFPRPFKIGRRTFFSNAEIAQWLADRPRVTTSAHSGSGDRTPPLN